MITQKLGNSGLEVSKLCLGGNVFGWTADEAVSFKILDAYAEAGGNFVDTADVYSRWVPGHKGGESETIIGNWMKSRGNRNKMVITTKVGHDMGHGKKGLSKEHILSSVEQSLERLQTDYIDLYLSHSDDEETPLEETLEIYAHLIVHGKVRVVGASNYTAKRLEKAIHASHKTSFPAYQVLQPRYNLYDRADYERHLEPLCQEYGLGVTPYYALASGFLTGKYRGDKDLGQSARGTRVKSYLNERGMRILNALDTVAKKHQCTPAAVSLAWLMGRPSISSPIASATSVDQLKDLLIASRLVLDKDSMAQLDTASDPDF